jgi:D-alanine-D-alanine ligase
MSVPGTRTTLALVFGGRSPEHDVSLVSARGIYDNLDRARFDVLLVGVERSGRPRLGGEALLDGGLARGEGVPVRWPSHPGDRALVSEADGSRVSPPLDVVFPIVHGSGGEDGTLQGMLALAGIPCVGPGVLGSSLAMDKDRARRVLEAERLPVARDAVFEGPELAPDAADAAAVAARVAALGWPVFVKPARAGSSVGITKVARAEDLRAALDAALAVDSKVVVEEAIADAREVEVAVLGNLAPAASIPGEIAPRRAFYDYTAKYLDDSSELLVPAPLGAAEADEIRGLALRAFRALDCLGMARVDFLLSRSDGRLIINEVNTLPGFTPISMYPRLWQATGVSYRDLLTRLVDLSVEAARLGPLVRGG